MKLLFDQNISYKLVQELQDLFPKSNHVKLLNLETASDEKIWQYARKNDFIIVTQDSDFNERSLIFGYPPKIIWLHCNNVKTKNIKDLLTANHQNIIEFSQNNSLGCFELY